MPETPVDEDRKLGADEDHIRSDSPVGKAERTVDPEPQAAPMEFGADSKLSGAVASAIQPHTLAHNRTGGGGVGESCH